MILVDTSVWVDHFRRTNDRLVELLDADQVLIHPMVIGELALGNLPQRTETLVDLARLPSAVVANLAETMTLIERERLHGAGVGLVDVSLLASVRLTSGASLWARDKRLAEEAARLGVAASP